MCFSQKTPKTEPPPIVQPPPSRDQAAEAASSERRRLRTQQGVYGNIFTSVLGDPSYGSSTARPTGSTAVATMGA